MSDISPLDNPVWYALTSKQSALARKEGQAARYPADVSRFVGLAQPSAEAFADLAALLPPGESAALCTAAPPAVPANWQVIRARLIEQMICERPIARESRLDLELGPDEVPEMLALTAATEPGPFSAGTIRMGRYFGVRAADSGRLVAMAGERLRLDGYTEISAVCTDPAARGKGYAGALVAGLAAKALAEDCVPILHVKNENTAKQLYESLGFRLRRALHLTVIKQSIKQSG